MYNTEDYQVSTKYKVEMTAAPGIQETVHPNSMIYMPELLQPDATARVNKSYVLKHPLSGFTSSPRATTLMGKS